MLGWHFSVYRQANGGSAPAPWDCPRGDRLAVWQAGWAGLRWLNELVKAGEAVSLGGNGYPYQYSLWAKTLRAVIDAGLPEVNEVWGAGPHDVLTAKWAGRTVIDEAGLEECQPEEWLIVEVWDES
jgi:hypothetical protein